MPTIGYSAPIQLLVAVRGHPFDRNAFDAIFQDMEGVNAVMVDHPAAARLITPEGMAGFDALVLYDMPGLDFDDADNRPRLVEPEPAMKEGLRALLDAGVGIVALHHALAGWPAWPEYADILGGRFLYRPASLRGTARLDSGYRHNAEYVARCVAPGHPVLEGVPETFAMRDELYLAEIFEEDVTPLLRAEYDFTAAQFHSASAAMDGRMYDNAGWDHADGSNLIGWTREMGPSRLVYLQPGDDAVTYDNPVYRRLVRNAIDWVIARG